KTLFSATTRGLRVWEANTGRLLGDLHPPGLHLRGAAVTRDGRLAALGGFQQMKEDEPDVGRIHLVEVATGKVLRTLERGPERSDHLGLAFTPDGKLLASFCPDGFARIEEVATGTEFLRHRFDRDIIGALAFSPDGTTLAVATGPNSRKVFVW